MKSCTECGREEHTPEECPATEWEETGGLGACEAYFILSTPEGRKIAATIPWGTKEYYSEVIEGTQMMHDNGECAA